MTNLIGQSLGRYHILEQLGEGGMATVYKAYDTHLERDVAVKIIRRDAFPPNQLELILKRFEREAKALARLSHPYIVKVHDYGEHEGSPYLVMEYLPGGTLKARLGRPIPWADAARLLLPVAQALEYAHEHDVIHRDVKPSNILLTEKGQPMLTDFGIAKILETGGAETLTGTGVGMGTPEYMAPEQWTGQTGPQSDLYSLGVVLYEMVTGQKPYVADTPAAILLKQVNDPLPRPAGHVRDLPAEVEKVLLKVLAKKPDDRYQGMGELIAALERLAAPGGQLRTGIAPLPAGTSHLDDEDDSGTMVQPDTTEFEARISVQDATALPVQAPPVPEPPQRKKSSGGYWALGLLGGLGCLLAIGTLIVLFNGEIKIGSPAPAPPATEAPAAAIISASNADRLVAVASLGKGNPRSIALSPDGTRLAVVTQGKIYLYDSQSMDEIFHVDTYATHAAFSSDGTLLASDDGSGVKILDAANGKEIRILSGHASSVNGLAFSPDGTLLASGSGTELIVWDTSTWQPVITLERSTKNRVSKIEFSHDSRFLAADSLIYINIWDRGNDWGKLTLGTHGEEFGNGQGFHPSSVAFSPDDRLLVSGSSDNTIKLWDLATSREIVTLKHDGWVDSVAFSPDGRLVASVGMNDITLWDVETHELVRTITATWVNDIAFSPRGTTLFSSSEADRVQAWDYTSGQLLGDIPEHNGYVQGLAFSPDGKTIASASGARVVYWDVKTALHLGTATQIQDFGYGTIISDIKFDPRSQGLVTTRQESTEYLGLPGGESLHTLNSAETASISFDGSRLALGSLENIEIWDMNTWQSVCLTKKSGWQHVSFSPDGRFLASGGQDNTIAILDPTNCSDITTLTGHTNWIGAVAFSPDGTTLATGDADGYIKFWDTASWQLLRTVATGYQYFGTITFSPDGKALAISASNTLQIIDTDSGTILANLSGHTDRITSVTFSPDGTILASGSDDGRILLWVIH